MIRVFSLLLMLVAIGGMIGGGFVLVRVVQERREASQSEVPRFIMVDTIHIPIRSPGGQVESVGYNLQIETRGGRSEELVRYFERKIRDGLRIELVRLTERRPPDNINNIEFVRVQLKDAANRVIAEELVKLNDRDLGRPPSDRPQDMRAQAARMPAIDAVRNVLVRDISPTVVGG